MAIKMLESRQDILAHLTDETKFTDLFRSIYEAYNTSTGPSYSSSYYPSRVTYALDAFSDWYKDKSAKYNVLSEDKLISSILACISICPVKNVLLTIIGALTLIDQEEIPKYLEQGGYKSALTTHAVLKWRLRNGV
jgi:hypothetical protein